MKVEKSGKLLKFFVNSELKVELKPFSQRGTLHAWITFSLLKALP